VRPLLLAALLVGGCSSAPLDPGPAPVVCFAPRDGGVFVTGLVAPVQGCNTSGLDAGVYDLGDLGWSRQGGVLVVPSSPAGQAVPVVFGFAGAGTPGETFRSQLALEGAVDAGVVFVYPSAVQGTWDIGPNSLDANRVDTLLRFLTGSVCIDPERVYIVGFSAGAVFTLYLGCNVPGTFRGMAVIAGTESRFDRRCCTEPIPALFIHGTHDGAIPLSEGLSARREVLNRDRCTTGSAPDQLGCIDFACPASTPVSSCEWDGGHAVPTFSAAEISDFFSL
jgi:Phospholipase/Carboxylesterase